MLPESTASKICFFLVIEESNKYYKGFKDRLIATTSSPPGTLSWPEEHKRWPSSLPTRDLVWWDPPSSKQRRAGRPPRQGRAQQRRGGATGSPNEQVQISHCNLVILLWLLCHVNILTIQDKTIYIYDFIKMHTYTHTYIIPCTAMFKTNEWSRCATEQRLWSWAAWSWLQPFHLATMWSWVNSLTFPNLIVLICIKGIQSPPLDYGTH